MTQKGEHTWDMWSEYHRCPECGLIFEDRQEYAYILGKYQKELSCPRCHGHFMHIRKREPVLGPLLGEPQPVETEWGDTAP